MHREKTLSVSSLPYCCEVSLDLGSLSTSLSSLPYLFIGHTKISSFSILAPIGYARLAYYIATSS